jgi:hypothetical protein
VTTLAIRRDVAQATLDAFFGKPLAWGKTDCARLGAFTLKGLGYKPALARGGFYSSPKGAWRALKRAGFDSLTAAIDALALPRIPPAAALPADLIVLPGEDGWDAVHVAVGNGRALGIAPGTATFSVLQPLYANCPQGRPAIAWRCEPCRWR